MTRTFRNVLADPPVLAAAITVGATTATLATDPGNEMPTTGPFSITIDDEVFTGASRAGTALTLGNPATAAHAIGTDVLHGFSRADSEAMAQSANNLSDLADAATARTNLGLGSAALLDLDTDTTLAADSDFVIPSQHAVKTYIDGAIPTVIDPVTAATFETIDPGAPPAEMDGVALLDGQRYLLASVSVGDPGIYLFNEIAGTLDDDPSDPDIDRLVDVLYGTVWAGKRIQYNGNSATWVPTGIELGTVDATETYSSTSLASSTLMRLTAPLGSTEVVAFEIAVHWRSSATTNGIKMAINADGSEWGRIFGHVYNGTAVTSFAAASLTSSLFTVTTCASTSVDNFIFAKGTVKGWDTNVYPQLIVKFARTAASGSTTVRAGSRIERLR